MPIKKIVTKAPAKKGKNEKAIASFINKKPVVATQAPEVIKSMGLRLSESEVNDIVEVTTQMFPPERGKKRNSMSIHDYVVRAVNEQIKRDREDIASS